MSTDTSSPITLSDSQLDRIEALLDEDDIPRHQKRSGRMPAEAETSA